MQHWESLVVAVIMVALIGELGGDHDQTIPTSASAPAAQSSYTATEELEVSLAELHAVFVGAAPSADLRMGWEDLRRDTRSVVNDLVRDPSSVDRKAMHNRIVSFWDSYETRPQLDPGMVEWRAFVGAFERFLGQLDDSASVRAASGLDDGKDVLFPLSRGS